MDEHDLKSFDALLPPIVHELINLIGYRHVVTVIDRLGGVSVPVCKNLQRSNNAAAVMLVEILPPEVLAIISKRFCGDMLYIPRCDAALRAVRNQHFFNEYDALLSRGISERSVLTMVCPRYAFTTRYAQHLLAERRKPEGEQIALFNVNH